MIPVKEYQIVSDDSKDGLSLKVEKALAVGWQPLGGVSVVSIPAYDRHNEPDGVNLEYSQAMVR